MTNAQAALIAAAAECAPMDGQGDTLGLATRYKKWLDEQDRDHQRQSGLPRRPRIDEAGD